MLYRIDYLGTSDVPSAVIQTEEKVLLGHEMLDRRQKDTIPNCRDDDECYLTKRYNRPLTFRTSVACDTVSWGLTLFGPLVF